MNKELISDTIEFYQNCIIEYDAKNQLDSNDFNFFSFVANTFVLNEPKHSRIIAFLLNPDEIHGQGSTFLHLFLKQLGISDFQDNVWKVYAEKGNVDILITSEYPTKKTIIIENKSNWAPDQENQLFRYWYENIFIYNNCDTDLACNYQNNRVIYLSPHEDKIYTPNSITNPNPDYDCDMEQLNEDIVNVWYFDKELKNWMNSCEESAKSDRVKVFLRDYRIYWEKTNNKEKFIMENLTVYFKESKEKWVDFNELIEETSKLPSLWITRFSDKLERISAKSWLYDKDGANDFRWYLGDWGSLSFVYEYHKGLTLWKNDFWSYKNAFKEDFITLFGEDFVFNDDETDNYVMTFKANILIQVDDKHEFEWIAGNEPEKIISVIEPILTKYMNNIAVIELFFKINSENNK